jgi:hypothetical protein
MAIATHSRRNSTTTATRAATTMATTRFNPSLVTAAKCRA